MVAGCLKACGRLKPTSAPCAHFPYSLSLDIMTWSFATKEKVPSLILGVRGGAGFKTVQGDHGSRHPAGCVMGFIGHGHIDNLHSPYTNVNQAAGKGCIAWKDLEVHGLGMRRVLGTSGGRLWCSLVACLYYSFHHDEIHA